MFSICSRKLFLCDRRRTLPGDHRANRLRPQLFLDALPPRAYISSIATTEFHAGTGCAKRRGSRRFRRSEPMSQPMMPKATALWMIENTGLSFKQIADFCGLHELEVKALADGDVMGGMAPLDPV